MDADLERKGIQEDNAAEMYTRKGELKTLKDINGGENWHAAERDDEIKQEAIKWCKADKSNFYSKQGKDETILWIKKFFNINDEDLK